MIKYKGVKLFSLLCISRATFLLILKAGLFPAADINNRRTIMIHMDVYKWKYKPSSYSCFKFLQKSIKSLLGIICRDEIGRRRDE